MERKKNSYSYGKVTGRRRSRAALSSRIGGPIQTGELSGIRDRRYPSDESEIRPLQIEIRRDSRRQLAIWPNEVEETGPPNQIQTFINQRNVKPQQQ